MRKILFVVLTVLFTATSYAQEEEKFILPPKPDYAELQLTGAAHVGQVVDPLRIRLHDGRIVQLAGIDIPDLTPYDTGELGLAALEWLKQTLAGREIRLYQSKDVNQGRINRMGYHLAHAEERGGGLWLQGALIANGLARVRPSAVNTGMAAQMLALEAGARAEKRGLWADPQYAVLTPETADKGLHGWAIVEGVVRANAVAGNNVYLNFGSDWRSDFTIGVTPATRRALTNIGLNPLGFAGKTVRIRGWVEEYNGPYIELMHPVWLEILPENPEAATLNR